MKVTFHEGYQGPDAALITERLPGGLRVVHLNFNDPFYAYVYVVTGDESQLRVIEAFAAAVNALREASAEPGDTIEAPLPPPWADRVVYVNDYGAVGDGTTDDTAAINAAIAALTAQGGGPNG